MKIAANLSMLFNELPLAERVMAARVAGFDGVEIQFPYELPAIHLKEQLERADLPLVLINLPAGDFTQGGPGLAAVPSRQAAFDAALQEALTYAAMVRPMCVNVLPGRLAEGLTRDQALETLAGNLRKSAEAFALLGIRVVCEAINPLDMPGFLVNTPDDLHALLQRVDHPNCQAQLDLYHMARQQLDVAAGIRLLGSRIGHVQFADCPGRGAPGTGSVAFEPLIDALRAVGYDGWLSAEYRPEGTDTHGGLGWLETWRKH
ncbi:hydroxypyruvate isomerase [Stutzerimonas stutzeri]|uniref:Hydroxypyruvate isomerase n=1 Tax=Stutzerimonas stutzeri TaxID=316 RepID=W8RWT0_STUST|nr:TIM barrel protein [Stutzerimonas stutzeri]AHL76511.1 hydroxypyruvate isomerase [Stutzerimonas stutzeri]MCQ4329746.1 TIM barrel protein [Stutzerimonas stutzeri]